MDTFQDFICFDIFYDLTGLLVRSRALLSYYYLRSGAIEGLWEHRL